MNIEVKRREQRLRQRAMRLGYQLRKSQGGYWIVDPNYNAIVAGDPTTGGMDLDSVESWLRAEKMAAYAGGQG